MTFLLLLFRFLVLFSCPLGLNFSVYSYPLFFNASWNIGAAELNISSFEDLLERRLFTPSGMLFIIEGGWLLNLWIYWGVLFGLLYGL